MTEVTTKPKRIQRLQIGLNLVVQLILIFFLVSAVNWIGFRHYKRRNKTVKASEMAEIDQSGMALGEGPRVTAFKGEQAITSAMIDLVEGKKNTIGYVTGHKEPSITEASPLAMINQQQQAGSPISDRKSTRLNSSHQIISYAVFC